MIKNIKKLSPADRIMNILNETGLANNKDGERNISRIKNYNSNLYPLLTCLVEMQHLDLLSGDAAQFYFDMAMLAEDPLYLTERLSSTDPSQESIELSSMSLTIPTTKKTLLKMLFRQKLGTEKNINKIVAYKGNSDELFECLTLMKDLSLLSGDKAQSHLDIALQLKDPMTVGRSLTKVISRQVKSFKINETLENIQFEKYMNELRKEIKNQSHAPYKWLLEWLETEYIKLVASNDIYAFLTNCHFKLIHINFAVPSTLMSVFYPQKNPDKMKELVTSFADKIDEFSNKKEYIDIDESLNIESSTDPLAAKQAIALLYDLGMGTKENVSEILSYPGNLYTLVIYLIELMHSNLLSKKAALNTTNLSKINDLMQAAIALNFRTLESTPNPDNVNILKDITFDQHIKNLRAKMKTEEHEPYAILLESLQATQNKFTYSRDIDALDTFIKACREAIADLTFPTSPPNQWLHIFSYDLTNDIPHIMETLASLLKEISAAEKKQRPDESFQL